ncbi:type II and III secretion system protein family protein [Spectribacter hydrogenoxidans]|uniref:Type II and III secretion system protein family protein n=1 Tax=Spectribacter hydrogenoxidans TaxID=3075608 RepID=A0ABU3C3B3_9GAMM|nr:type II and III secretion system protein family protein [Salinisphaera sp. W335]MDT0636040.1 type II and III secretion system protein family protein [Salinisphaera sp. W335]
MQRLVIAVIGLFGAGLAHAEIVQVGVGNQEVVKTEQRIDRVALGDPEIAGVNVLGVREMMLTGKKRGDTTLLVWPKGGDTPMRYSVVVGSGDLPDVLLDGKRDHVRTQVQTDIRIAEVSRSAIRRLGFNFLNNAPGENVLRASPPGASAGAENLGGNVNLLSSTGFQPIGDAFNLLFADGDGDFFSFVSILERRGLMRTLAEPSLVAMSGQTATFLAGGEFPIPVVQSGGGNGSVTVEFKEFGIRLSLTPTVLENERIALKVAPEVSELDFTAGVTVQGVQVPGVRVRRTDTMVELGDGESFIISGLVDQDLAANVDKVPWLGDIPILGTFFRSTSYERQDRELIMVVTPHLVTPLAPETRVKLPGEEYEEYDPSAAELFFLEKGDFEERDTGFTR